MEDIDDYLALAQVDRIRERLEFQSDLWKDSSMDRQTTESVNRQWRRARAEIEELLCIQNQAPTFDVFARLKDNGGML